MKLLISLFPIITIVVASQLIIKWRITDLYNDTLALNLFKKFIFYISDPWIFITYFLVFISSLIYITVLEKYPVSLVYPLQIGLTVLLVNLGGVVLLSESLNIRKFFAIILIILGITLISSTD